MNGAVLSDEEIRNRGESLIRGFNKKALSGASYDLCLGDECFSRGETVMLSDHRPSFRLEPGQFILLTSFERLDMPVDVVARAGLVSRWAQRGLISLFSPQIDPGFLGVIVVPLFNGGQSTVTIKRRERMFTVEFVHMSSPASFSWRDQNDELTGIPTKAQDVETGAPDLSKLLDRVAALERADVALKAQVEGYQAGFGLRQTVSATTAGWVGVGLAVLAVLLAVAGVILAVIAL